MATQLFRCFSGPLTRNGALQDGNYELLVHGASISGWVGGDFRSAIAIPISFMHTLVTPMETGRLVLPSSISSDRALGSRQMMSVTMGCSTSMGS